MIATKVELCNHALSYLGESRISSLEEGNERARICSLLYGQTRDELLSDFEWPFAIQRRALAAVSEDNPTKYEYRYALPADYLMIIDLLDSDTFTELTNWRTKQYDFDIENDRLMTDLSPCYIKYVYSLDLPNKYPASFDQAFILSLAAKIAPRLSQNFTLAGQMAQYAAGAVLKAKAELKKASVPRPTRKALYSEVN
ncbi:MAG: hypothetical protein DRZ90_11640 [Spirochaetes bacterium]|nr:MAG: hypothetical protein DRZ90_11640 [Spirochaetota bacterium]